MLENTNGIRENVGVDAIEGAASQLGGRRSIDAILARRSRRLLARRETFAPDFLHGSVQLDEIYRVLDFTWIEQSVFIEPIYNNAGEVLAVSVAYFNDYFLTIEQAVVGEVEDLDKWVEERVAARKTCIELVLKDEVSEDARDGFWQTLDAAVKIIPIQCSSTRLTDMEFGLLSVTRDGDRGDRERFRCDQDTVLQDSRTNLLSLITLFSQLISE